MPKDDERSGFGGLGSWGLTVLFILVVAVILIATSKPYEVSKECSEKARELQHYMSERMGSLSERIRMFSPEIAVNNPEYGLFSSKISDFCGRNIQKISEDEFSSLKAEATDLLIKMDHYEDMILKKLMKNEQPER